MEIFSSNHYIIGRIGENGKYLYIMKNKIHSTETKNIITNENIFEKTKSFFSKKKNPKEKLFSLFPFF